MHDISNPKTLVVDLGTSNTKAGWTSFGEPDLMVPSVVGRGRHKGAMLTLGLKDSYVGRQAQSLQGILSLRQPFRGGCVQHWDDLELLWDHVWSHECQQINGKEGDADSVDPKGYHVLVSVPPLCPPEDWRRLAEILLEGAGVGGIYLANKSVLSMYGGGRTTGVCVDSGADMTYIVPCWEGSPLPNATVILKLGGRHITDRLLSLLSNGKYSFPDDTFLLMRRSGGSSATRNRFCIASRRDVVREAKERYCIFSDRVTQVGGGPLDATCEEKVLRLPDGNMVVVGEEAFTAPELMFKPDLIKKSYSGLHVLVYESIMRCDERLRSRLLSNIMLTGGNSLIPNLNVRLQKELSEILPKNTNVRVSAQKGRDNFTWNGGAHLSSLSSFQRLWLTKQDYMETGATLSIQEANVLEQK